jgi:hypothetical protein
MEPSGLDIEQMECRGTSETETRGENHPEQRDDRDVAEDFVCGLKLGRHRGQTGCVLSEERLGHFLDLRLVVGESVGEENEGVEHVQVQAM